MSRYFGGLVALLLPLAGVDARQAPAPCPPEAPAVASLPAGPPAPAMILLGPRHGHAVPSRCGHSHTGAGNIDVAQPFPDTIVITMTGVAAAGANPCTNSEATQSFDLCQDFEVRFVSTKLKKAKLVVDARVIGLLRSPCKGGGTAGEGPGCATVSAGELPLVTACAPEHTVAGGENLSINDHSAPYEVPIVPGIYALHQTFTVSTAHPRTWCPGKAVAEFGADAGLDRLWIGTRDPFSGASKTDFGFQVTLKVVEDTSASLPADAPEPFPPAQRQLKPR
jgi:hypothetical protein